MTKYVNVKLNKAFTIAETVIAVLCTLIFLALFIVIGVGAIRIGICIVWIIFMIFMLCRKNKQEPVACIAEILAILLILAFISLFAPVIRSGSPWKYNYQRQYIELYNENSSEDFPDTLPEDIEDYRFEYTPSIMQGNGHCSVRFTAPAETVRDIENEYAPIALYSLPLSRFDYHTARISEEDLGHKLPEDSDNQLTVHIDRDFWGDTEATVYVLSAVLDWNHPHSHAVIISSDYSKIQFSQY